MIASRDIVLDAMSMSHACKEPANANSKEFHPKKKLRIGPTDSIRLLRLLTTDKKRLFMMLSLN